MGFLSKLFSRKESAPSTQPNISATVNANNGDILSDIPPLQGDYAKTIFLWAHDKATAVRKNDEYARYFLYECGITDPSAYHLELIHTGYFECAPLDAILNSLKVADLKQFLSSIGQVTTGKKDALIERIIQNADNSTIKAICPDPLYVLSEMGRNFLSDHNDYVLVHKHKNWGIGWKEYDAHRRPGCSFYDTVWGIINKRIANDNQNFGRNEYLCMYQLLAEEGKRNRAIEMLLRVLYIDLSGVCGMNCYKMYKDGFYTQKELLEHFNVTVILAPGIINPISEYKDVYSDDIVNHLYEQKLPVQICSKTLFLNIVHSILDGTYDEEIVEKHLKTAYTKMVKALQIA